MIGLLSEVEVLGNLHVLVCTLFHFGLYYFHIYSITLSLLSADARSEWHCLVSLVLWRPRWKLARYYVKKTPAWCSPTSTVFCSYTSTCSKAFSSAWRPGKFGMLCIDIKWQIKMGTCIFTCSWFQHYIYFTYYQERHGWSGRTCLIFVCDRIFIMASIRYCIQGD